MQNKTKLDRLIELQKRKILLLKAVERKIEDLQTYEDENFKIIIQGFDPRLRYQTKEKNLVY